MKRAAFASEIRKWRRFFKVAAPDWVRRAAALRRLPGILSPNLHNGVTQRRARARVWCVCFCWLTGLGNRVCSFIGMVICVMRRFGAENQYENFTGRLLVGGFSDVCFSLLRSAIFLLENYGFCGIQPD